MNPSLCRRLQGQGGRIRTGNRDSDDAGHATMRFRGKGPTTARNSRPVDAARTRSPPCVCPELPPARPGRGNQSGWALMAWFNGSGGGSDEFAMATTAVETSCATESHELSSGCTAERLRAKYSEAESHRPNRNARRDEVTVRRNLGFCYASSAGRKASARAAPRVSVTETRARIPVNCAACR